MNIIVMAMASSLIMSERSLVSLGNISGAAIIEPSSMASSPTFHHICFSFPCIAVFVYGPPFKQCIAEFVIEKKLIAMNKKQLVKRVSQKTGLTLTESNEFLNSVLDTISDTLKNKEDVFLRGFGSFMVKDRKPRRTMSLNTRKMITIPGKKVVKFRTQIL